MVSREDLAALMHEILTDIGQLVGQANRINFQEDDSRSVIRAVSDLVDKMMTANKKMKSFETVALKSALQGDMDEHD